MESLESLPRSFRFGGLDCTLEIHAKNNRNGARTSVLSLVQHARSSRAVGTFCCPLPAIFEG